MTPEETAWLAGLIEGEGCFSVDRSGGAGRYAKPRCKIAVKMNDRDIIERVRSVTGLGRLKIGVTVYENPRWNDSYTLQITGRDAERIMRAIRPYMGQRRAARIDEILALDLGHRKDIA